MLTCRHFHSLLTGHGHIIVQAVAFHATQTEKIILFNLAKTGTKWSPFAWLESGHHMNTTIDRVLFHLERAGALKDENHLFRAGTTNQDPAHARRVLRSTLLALQMISMQGQWDDRADYVLKKPPDLLNSLARHVDSLVKFLVCNAYLYIHGLDADMSGTQDLHRHPVLNGLYPAFFGILLGEVLALGPSVLLQLLERKQKFPKARDFLIWLWYLSKDKDPWRLQREQYLVFFLEGLFS